MIVDMEKFLVESNSFISLMILSLSLEKSEIYRRDHFQAVLRTT